MITPTDTKTLRELLEAANAGIKTDPLYANDAYVELQSRSGHIIKTLLDEVDRLREQTRWIPVDERLPDVGQKVFARYEGVYENRPITFCIDGGGNPHFGSENEPDGNGSQPATHWMPRPQPPEAP